jgi:hypothetical protein
VFSKPASTTQLYNLTHLNSEQTPDGFIRYSAGRFREATSALKAKNELSAKGVSDAFIVAYYKGKRIGLMKAQELIDSGKEKIIAASNETTAEPTNERESDTLTGVIFKVQIGAYREQVPIEEANRLLRFAGNGIKTFTDPNGLMIYTVGEFTLYSEAVNLKSQLVNQGLSDAFVIGMKNGKKLSAEEMKKAMQ